MLKKTAVSVFTAVLCLSSLQAQARDSKLLLSIQEAMQSSEAREVLDPAVKVTFAGGSGRIIQSGLVSNKKTNAAGKTDEAACRRAFLSAVKQFQETAAKSGANKVVNLVSYYRKNPFRSTSQYECHAGTFVAGVALKGDLAR